MFKCKDCGGEIIDSPSTKNIYKRDDICGECWENKGWVINNRSTMGIENFNKIQDEMRGGRGTVKKLIEKIKKPIERE